MRGALRVCRETLSLRNVDGGRHWVFPRLVYTGLIYKTDFLIRRSLYLLFGWPTIRFRHAIAARRCHEGALLQGAALGAFSFGVIRSVLSLAAVAYLAARAFSLA